MATPAPPQSFALDHSLFNETLYSRLRELWFRGIPEGAVAPTPDIFKKWFGAAPQHEKDALDEECRSIALPALESVGPSQLSLPPFKSYDKEIEHAETIAQPFLTVIKKAHQDGEEKGASTLLSLVLLLDQMPRNIYRDQAELPLIYGHYDRLAYSLIRASLKLSPNLVEHPSIANRIYWLWFLLPLQHSEHLRSHELAFSLQDRWRDAKVESDDGPAAIFYKGYLRSHEDHVGPLSRFGRYPHRNQCLGRENTSDEEEFLKTAKTFGVKQQEKEVVKDEL